MENENINYLQQEQQKLIAELAILHGERISKLSERVAWSEVCFRRVEDSGVIHMANIIKKMVQELEMLKIKHNKLNAFIKAHLGDFPPEDGDQQGGGSQSPPVAPSTQQVNLTRKYAP